MYLNLSIFALISLGIAIWVLNTPVLITLVILSGVVCGVNNTVTTQAVMTVSPVERPVASAAYSFVRFIGGGLAPYVAGRLVADFNIHVPFYLGAGVIVLGIGILTTGHKLLGDAERVQAEAASAALHSGPAELAAEREFEAEEKAEALAGDAD
jgi:MFS family permease